MFDKIHCSEANSRNSTTLFLIVKKNNSYYSKNEEDQAFVHANCMFVHEEELNGQCNSSERKRPYSRVLYLVLFDTSLESNFVLKILAKNKPHF
jgi:hypothetical protein